MCGIAGYAGTHDPALLLRMCRTMAYRGPDDEGTWTDAKSGVGLGHRRLSIIDVSPLGHQPMVSDDGQIVISYNGEVYNFPELRHDLEKDGRPFRSRTDTEVILRLYERDGLDCLDQLNGMFALAIWDGRLQRLVVARDHAGIKPVYWWQDGDILYFASELKALLSAPGLTRNLNYAAIVDYLTFMWVPGDETMLAGVRKLHPGHYLTWQSGRTVVRPWFRLDYEPDSTPTTAEWIETAGATLTRTMRRQMVADVPLGTFLSGGLDSSSIAACMRNAYPERQITAYTARFPPGEIASEQGVDDYPFAERVARHLRLDLESVDIAPDVVALLPKLVYHLDEPDADPAIFPSYLISRRARDDGMRVLLSGTGGDEVFFGYRSHSAHRLYDRLWHVPPAVADAALAAAVGLAARLTGATSMASRRLRKFRRGLTALPGLARHLALVDWSDAETRDRLIANPRVRLALESKTPPCLELYSGMFAGRGGLNHHSHLLVQTFLAAHNFLYTDRSSMAASIEVRVPFMDVELMRLAARIPEHLKLKGRQTKFVLKRAMEPLLPRDVIYRSKTGFGAPLRKWIRGDLAAGVRRILADSGIRNRGIFAPEAVQRVLEENQEGRVDHAYLIYALLNLELWMATFLDRPGECVTI